MLKKIRIHIGMTLTIDKRITLSFVYAERYGSFWIPNVNKKKSSWILPLMLHSVFY